jgi:tetratricopeptide (TPR) repeat protein
LFYCKYATSFYTKAKCRLIIQKIAVEKDEDKKVDLIFSFFSPGFDSNPGTLMEVGQALLKQSEKNKDILIEASAYCFIGFGYRMAGSFIKALEYHQKSLALAEKCGNLSILAMTKNLMGHIYRDREEYDEGLKLYLSALFDSERGKNNMVKAWPLMNIGSMYFKMSKPDSALSYLQRSYELTLKYDTLDLPYVLWNLGGVHSLMGNAALAITYYNMAIQKAIEGNRIRQLNWTYVGLAEHYQRMNQPDSCIFYAKKSIAAAQNTAFSFMCIKPPGCLLICMKKLIATVH